MMVSFDFLTTPLDLSGEAVVLCIETPLLYTRIVSAFCSEQTEEHGIVFSHNDVPLKYRTSVCYIHDVFRLEYSASFMKKLYEELSITAQEELETQTTQFRLACQQLMQAIVEHSEYTLQYEERLEIADVLKLQKLRPLTEDTNVVEALYEYMLLIHRFIGIRCFVVRHLHDVADGDSLAALYRELRLRGITILVLEGHQFFQKVSGERFVIVDEDLCEILEKTE